MALIACSECGAQVSTKAKACPKCGARVPRTRWWLWVPLGLVGAFLVFGLTVANTPEARAKAEARQAIELCWQQQGRRSLDPATQRFAAGACEAMEVQFRRRFGVAP